MIQTVFNGQGVFLVNEAPDWARAVEGEFSLFRDSQASLTHREGRRPYSASLLTTLRYTASVRRAAMRAWMGSLRTLNTQSVILPFWPAIGYWANRAAASIKGGLMVVWRDTGDGSPWQQYAIYLAGAEPAVVGGFPAAGDFVAPALMGLLAPGKSGASRRDVIDWEVTFNESGPLAYALAPQAPGGFSAGPQPAGYAAAPPLLPFYPDRANLSEQLGVEVKREHLGFSRQTAQSFYTQAAEHLQEASYTLSDPDIGSLLNFFLLSAGPGAPFWAPTSLTGIELTADAAPGDTVLQVSDNAALVIGDYLLLFPNGGGPVVRQVQALGMGTVTLTVAVGVALSSAGGAHGWSLSPIFPLCLARTQKPVLKVTWQRPGFATGILPWGEVPAEYAPAADETLNTTIGLLPQRAYLYEFTRTLAGTVVTDRFTSYEGNLNFGGNVYTSGQAADLNHGEIRSGLALDRDEVEIDAMASLGGALLQFAILGMEVPLYVTIRQADTDGVNASNVSVVFTGEVVKVSPSGSRLKALAVPGGSIFDRKVPRFHLQTCCNHALFSPGCGLAQADWKFSAQMNAVPAGGYPFSYVITTLTGVGASAAAAIAAGGIFDQFFVPGWIEFGAAGTWNARAILASVFVAPGIYQLTLDRDAAVLPSINDAVVLYPGCDLRYSTCGAFSAPTNPSGKFNNALNFGGHPFLPVSNPSLVAPAPSTAGGKK